MPPLMMTKVLVLISCASCSFEMAASFGHHLVFDLDGRGTGALKVSDGFEDVDRLAKPSVGVDDQGQTAGPDNVSHGLGELVEREDSDVGNPQSGRERCS